MKEMKITYRLEKEISALFNSLVKKYPDQSKLFLDVWSSVNRIVEEQTKETEIGSGKGKK